MELPCCEFDRIVLSSASVIVVALLIVRRCRCSRCGMVGVDGALNADDSDNMMDDDPLINSEFVVLLLSDEHVVVAVVVVIAVAAVVV